MHICKVNHLKTLNFITPEHFLKLFCNASDKDLPNALNFCGIRLMSRNKSK